MKSSAAVSEESAVVFMLPPLGGRITCFYRPCWGDDFLCFHSAGHQCLSQSSGWMVIVFSFSLHDGMSMGFATGACAASTTCFLFWDQLCLCDAAPFLDNGLAW